MENINQLIEKEKITSKQMNVLMIIIIIVFFLRDGFGKNIPVIVFFVLYFLGFLILSRNELLQFFLFLIPLSNGSLLYYLNLVFGIFFIFKNAHSIKITNAITTSLLLVLWEVLHLLPNTFLGYNENIFKLLGFTLCLIVTTLIISNYKIKNNYISIMFSWCFGLGAFCGIMLTKYIHYFGLANFTTAVRRFGWIPASLDYSSTSMLMNPNELGKLVIITVFCLLTILKVQREYSYKIVFLITYFILFGLMSASRSFLIVFFTLLFVFMLELIIKPKHNKRIIIVLIITTLLMLIFVTIYMRPILIIISDRFKSGDVSGSRFDIYRKYFNILRKSPYLIFGSGMQDYNEKYGLPYSSHNFFIEIISIWGIVGLALTFFWCIGLYSSLKLKKFIFLKNKTILPLLPLLGLFLYEQTGQFFISYYNTFPPLIIALLNIKYAELDIKNSLSI